jgi:hypothetical protein
LPEPNAKPIARLQGLKVEENADLIARLQDLND